MDHPTASASIEVDAPPSVVYDIVSDVTRLPEWAAETEKCWWVGGAKGAEVGARFRGTNRYRRLPWTTTCAVTAAEPGRRFAFDVSMFVLRTAQWEYEIEPVGAGCRVTESTKRLLPGVLTDPANRLIGVRNRDAHNQHNIEMTLERLKAYAEQRASNGDAPSARHD